MGPYQCILLVLAVLACCEAAGKNYCTQQKTCGKCIEAGPECGWCTQDGFDLDNKVRCNLVENLVPAGCDNSFIVQPDHNITYVENVEVQNAVAGGDAVQLSPQEINLKLRPNKKFHLPVTFRQAQNYPVDLYYVMDLSYSMNDDKAKLAELGEKLAQRMKDITTNFRLGFGSFVDKKTMPYVSMAKEIPCTGCVPAYGFKNHMRLTDAAQQFREEVMSAPISGNLDGPEGGFDAIMQAIVCKKKIGWRSISRKLLLYATDASFHLAGDGKLGGIVKPNDGECHLDENDLYSESLNQDYPSISQLSHKIKEKKVNVIFAVTGGQLHMYNELGNFIEGSTVGELANDSSNVVELVRQNYEKISSTVSLKVDGAGEGIKVTFKSRCRGLDVRDTDKCEGLKIGENVTFDMSIEVVECPKNKAHWKQTFEVYPVGLTERLRINLDMICECDCEDASLEVPNSDRCNKSGTFECGACTCNPGYYGKYCECDSSNQDSAEYDLACRQTNTSEVCEGRGQCLCGICECNPTVPGDPSQRYTGDFCECDDYACDYFNGKLCGGPERGKCKCSQCMCNDGFNGTACECATGQELCRALNGKICNEKGTCICGECICNIDTYYKKPTCEDCPTCPGRCEVNKACVQCTAFQSGEMSKDDCDANCTHVYVVDQVEGDAEDRKLCRFRDDDDCIFYFTYEYNSDRVEVQRTKECPQPLNVLAIVLGIVLGIILIGLVLLLLWKLFTTIHDRREFAKFEKERQNAKWDTGENPIYKQATSTFKNPMYQGQK